jgi:hypothetical protein
MENLKKEKLGRGNQKAVYATLGNALERAENELDNEFDVKNLLAIAKLSSEMTKAYLAEIAQAACMRENEKHSAVIRNSKVHIRNIENKPFDEI